MAGIHGNNAWIMFKKQSAKGAAAKIEAGESTPAKQKAFKVPYSGGSIAPNRVFGKLAETDSSRDQGVSFAKVGGVTGTPECYVRDDSVGALLTYVLGEDTVTGTTNLVHKIKPATNIPYVTVWNNVGNTLYEEYTDCNISSVNIKTTAGEPLTAAFNVVGVKSTRLTSDPSTTPVAIPLDSNYVYNFNDATVELSSGVTALIGSFDLTINNNVTPQQTDSFTPLDVVAGIRQIDLTFDMIFENLEEYNKFNYGGASGVNESNVLYTTSANFLFQKSGATNNSVNFKFTSIAYETFPIAPNVTGAPIVTTVKAVAQRATPIMEAEVKNQVEGY